MEIILLENIRNLGKFGTKVNVAKGYGRNFLIPTGKAVPATSANLKVFEAKRVELEEQAQARLAQAQTRAEEIQAHALQLSARAAEGGKLYGSIGTAELVKAFAAQGVKLRRQELLLPEGPIREIGTFKVEVQLHAEVVAVANVTITPERT
jgi:large subunit ribosomal protein L9